MTKAERIRHALEKQKRAQEAIQEIAAASFMAWSVDTIEHAQDDGDALPSDRHTDI